MTNIFSNLQVEIAELLAGDSWFAGTPPIGVVQEIHGYIGKEIDARIKGCGVVVVVTTPKIARGDRENPGELVVTVLLGVGEMVRTNRGPTGTQKPAHDIAMALIGTLDRWQPLSSSWQALEFREASVVDGPSDLVSWQVSFEARIRVVGVTEDNP